MTAITRVNDIGRGYCTCHRKDVIVTFQQGCKTVLAENLELGAVSIIIGRASCGHPTIAKTGSSTVYFENQVVHRIHDTGEIGPGCGTYTVSTGSPTVFADDGPSTMFINKPTSAGFNNATPEKEVPITPAQQQTFDNNVSGIKKYNTPDNIADGVDGHPELEDDPDAPPPTPVPATVANPDCSTGGDLGARLDEVLIEAKNGQWKETGRNSNILSLSRDVGIPQGSDSVAWCAAFVGSTLKNNCFKFNKSLAAGSYTGYGNPVAGGISNAQRGDVLIFHRDAGTGHVAFYDGPGPRPGTVYIIGGNQSNNVTRSVKSISQLKVNGVQRPLPA